MPAGIILNNNKYSGVIAEPDRNGINVTSSIPESEDTADISGAIIGIPFDRFFIKTVPLPIMEKAKLQEAVNLQISFHLPYDEKSAHITHQIQKRKKDQALVIVATPKIREQKVKAVFPIPIALAGLGIQFDFLKADKSTLVVCITNDHVHTLTLKGFKVMFMRTFPRDNMGNGDTKGLVRDLRLSCQEVYFQEERHSIKPDQTIVFAKENNELEDFLVNQYFGELRWVPPEKCIKSNVKAAEMENLFVPCGLAALHKHLKKFKGWNVNHTEIDYLASIKRGILYTIPLWPLFLLLYYYGDISSINRKIDALEGKKRALAPKYRQVIDVEENVTIMENFMSDSGMGAKTPGMWFDLIALLEKQRPENLWINTISGKAYNVCIANGKTKSYPKVTKFIKNLDASGEFDDLQLVYTQKTEKDVDFQISFKIKTEEEERD